MQSPMQQDRPEDEMTASFAFAPHVGTVTAWLETAEGNRLAVGPSCTLGRCASNQIVLSGEKVSRKHTLLHTRLGDELWISDLGSSNGTYLNGRKLEQSAPLYNGDQIAIGPHRLIFHQPGGPKRPSQDLAQAEKTL